MMRPVGLVRSDATLIAAAVVPAEPDAFGEETAVIVPAPGSFVSTATVAVEGCSAADVAA